MATARGRRLSQPRRPLGLWALEKPALVGHDIGGATVPLYAALHDATAISAIDTATLTESSPYRIRLREAEAEADAPEVERIATNERLRVQDARAAGPLAAGVMVQPGARRRASQTAADVSGL